MLRRLFVLAASLAATAPSFGQTASGTAQLTQSPPPACTNCLAISSDTIYLDASGGKLMFPLPSSQRNFASMADFVTFINQDLHATPLYDSAGNVNGLTGGLVEIGQTYYFDPSTNIFKPITDPIGAYIGGLAGQFTVAGVTYTTGLQGQSFLRPQRAFSYPNDVYRCNVSGECVSSHSWNIHWIANVRDSVGIEIDQETGGYQESHYFCWNGPCPFCIPWICTSSSGTNSLSMQGTLYRRDPAGNLFAAWNTRPFGNNVPGLNFSRHSYCFGVPGVGSICLGNDDAKDLVGACEGDTSAAIPSVGGTADGSTLQCP